MLQVEEQINRVKTIFQQVTGNAVPDHQASNQAPIPPDTDAESFVRENLQRLDVAMRGLETSPRFTPAAVATPVVTPRLNVWENDKEWCCSFDMPGIEKGQVSVQVHHGVLRVEAVRHVTGNNGHRVVHMECGPSRYARQVMLPTFIKADTTEAKLVAGVLHVRVQKDVAASHRDVNVTVA